MSNQAVSRSDDLMVGAGALFFKRSDDPHGLHHLGNVEEFNITTDVTTVEKNSSMNKDRALMASVVTAVNPTATLTMNEYNPYNLALGLYGREGVRTQVGGAFLNEAYTIPSVPGVIELKDANGERYMDVSNVSIGLSTAIAASFTWDTFPSTLQIDSSAIVPNTVVEAPYVAGVSERGGKIELKLNGYTGAMAETIYLQIEGEPTTPGDLAGMILNVTGGPFTGLPGPIVVPAGTPVRSSYTIPVPTTPMEIEFTLGANTASSADPAFEANGDFCKIVYTPSTSSGVAGTDYYADDQMLRAGIIQIPSGSTFSAGDQVFINFTAKDGDFVTVSGSDAGEIEGQLLFIGDPNIGGMYNIEGWKVKVTPNGDLTGLIGSDFGSFQLNVKFLSDKANHPDCQYYRATMIGRADGSTRSTSVYDPEY